MGARKWVIGGFLAAAVLIVGLGVFAFRAKEEREQAALDAALADALARAESLGVPVRADHLRGDPIPDEDNAWVELNEISDLYWDSLDQGPYISEIMKISDKAEWIAVAEEALPAWQTVFGLAEAVAGKQGYQPEREWESGMAMLVYDLASDKGLVRALMLRARHELYQGDLNASIDSFHTASAITNLLQHDATMMGVLVSYSMENIIAQEIVFQVGRTDSERHKSDLRGVLDTLFQPKDVVSTYQQEVVLMLEALNMVSEENVYGNKLRKEIKDGGGLSVIGKIAGMSLPAKRALKFEALGIQAACDFHKSLSPDLGDYAANDARFMKFAELPGEWVLDGYPYGLVEIMYTLGWYDDSSGIRPYALLARRELDGEVFRRAFEIVTGSDSLDDGVRWPSNRLATAEFEYLEYEGGFSIAMTAPDLKPRTLKFDRP